LILSQDQTLVCNLNDSPLDGSRGNRVGHPALERRNGSYIVRSLELATRAFQDSSALTSKQTISRLARSTCCQRPNSHSRLSGALQSNSWHPKASVVLETLSPPQSRKTRRDEPFKSTAAVLDSSTRSVRFSRRCWFPWCASAAFCRRVCTFEVLLFKELLRRSLRLAKPFRAWAPASADLLWIHSSLGARVCLFIGFLSDVSGHLSDSTSKPGWLPIR